MNAGAEMLLTVGKDRQQFQRQRCGAILTSDVSGLITRRAIARTQVARFKGP